MGQQNPTDNFTRLLASLVYTGIAPESFYKDPNGPDRHYDGMWVPFPASHDTLIDNPHDAFKARSQALGHSMAGFLVCLSCAPCCMMQQRVGQI